MISVDVVSVDIISRLVPASVKRFEFDSRVVISHDVKVTVFYLRSRAEGSKGHWGVPDRGVTIAILMLGKGRVPNH